MIFSTSRRFTRKERLGPGGSRGVTLVEVLVSILVVSLGLLAMAAMQTSAMRYNKTSEMRAVATLLARDVADRIRANSIGGVPQGTYTLNTAYGSAVLSGAATLPNCADTSSCTGAEMATRDLAEWRNSLWASLPGAAAWMVVNGTAAPMTADLWIAWLDPGEVAATRADSGAASECPAAFVAANTNPMPRCMYFRIGL